MSKETIQEAYSHKTYSEILNLLVPDTPYSERQDKPFSLQIQ